MSVIKENAFDIILDAQSKIKFLTGIAINNDERFFSTDAERVVRCISFHHKPVTIRSL